jgi:hypothetical protein
LQRPPARAERLANFNDAYARSDAGAHQSGTAPMRFGLDAAPRPSHPCVTC